MRTTVIIKKKTYSYTTNLKNEIFIKFIYKKDFIYKTIICDFYLSYKLNEQIDKQISEIVFK